MAKTPTLLNMNLSEALVAAQELQVMLAQMEYAFDNDLMGNGYQLALESVNLVEQLAMKVRKIPIHTGHPKALKDVNKEILDAVPVKMGYSEQGWFVLRIPALLPLKEKGDIEYIRGFLYPALKEYFRDKHPTKFDKCIIIYRHVYDQRTPQRLYRDHDNIEINFVTDAIALMVMVDDAAHRCQHHYYSEAGAEEMTEVFVVPLEDYRAWLEAAEHFPKEGIPLK